MAEKASRTVFIGNIPYGQSEEQIKEICSTVGHVVSFRPIYDSDTGRPKGFGFVEYADSDAAASAVRNLNGYKIEGRELRVDFSKRSDGDAPDTSDTAPSAMPPQPQPHQRPQQTPQPGGAGGIGPLPPGVEVPAGLTCQDAISKTLSTLPPPQLLDILSQMKNLVTGDPAKATELLRQAPQLSYAIFQALLLMGLVDSGLMASVVQQAAAGVSAPPPNAMPERPGPPQQPTPVYGGPGHAPTPPQHQGMYSTPPQHQAPPPPQQQQQQQQQQPNQSDLLKQVLEMPQSVVDSLPERERKQIMELKQQFGGRIGY